MEVTCVEVVSQPSFAEIAFLVKESNGRVEPTLPSVNCERAVEADAAGKHFD